MSQFRVSYATTGWCSYTVEADSEAEAIEKVANGEAEYDDSEHLNMFDPEAELVSDEV